MNTTELLRKSLYGYRLRWLYRYFRAKGQSVMNAFNAAKMSLT